MAATAPSSNDPDAYDQWLFTEDELENTPSRMDGISKEKERESRGKGCNFILQVGMLLGLPQVTLATASVYLHRFYMRESLKNYHYYVCEITLPLQKKKTAIFSNHLSLSSFS